MKLLEKIINDNIFMVSSKYSIDINKILPFLLENEIEIPEDIYLETLNNREQGAAFSYIESLGKKVIVDYIDGFSVPLFIEIVELDEENCLIAVAMHKFGDIRSVHDFISNSKKGYTDAFLLKFTDAEDFYFLLENLKFEGTFMMDIDNQIYSITPAIMSDDNLTVKQTINNEVVEIDDIWACCDEELINIIRTKTNNMKKKKLLRPKKTS